MHNSHFQERNATTWKDILITNVDNTEFNFDTYIKIVDSTLKFHEKMLNESFLINVIQLMRARITIIQLSEISTLVTDFLVTKFLSKKEH